MWKKDFGPEAALCAVRTDPSDARRLCLCGQRGSLIVLRLTNMARDRVEQQTYKVDMSASKAGDALRAVFSTTCDLLYVLLPREASPTSCLCHVLCCPSIQHSHLRGVPAFHAVLRERRKQASIAWQPRCLPGGPRIAVGLSAHCAPSH